MGFSSKLREMVPWTRRKNDKQKAKKRFDPRPPRVFDGISDAIDVISPDGIHFPLWSELLERNNGYFQTNGDRLTRTYMVAQHPSHVYMGYLSDFYSVGDVDISIHVYPGEPDEDVEDLNDMVIRLETQMYVQGARHTANDAVVEASFQDTKELRDKISLNRDRLIYNTVYISVSATSKEELKEKCDELERIAGAKMMRLKETFLEEDLGLISAAPLGINAIQENHSNFDLSASTALFPFDSPELTHPRGTWYGTNHYTGAPVFYDSYATKDAKHTGIFGLTRVGKSSLVKAKVARNTLKGVRTCYFDPEGEAGPLVRKLGGEEFIFKPGEFCGINLFDLETDEFDNSNHLLSKIEEVKSILLYMMEKDNAFPLTPEEEALLEKAIREEYTSRGITDDPRTLFEDETRDALVGRKKKSMPTITSLYNRLQTDEYQNHADRMVTRLMPYLADGTMGMYDGETSISIRKLPAFSFNLKALDNLPKLLLLSLTILQPFVWEHFVKKDIAVQKDVVYDEAWLFAKLKVCLMFYGQMSRRAAKRNCSLTVASQNFREFTATEEGKVVLSQLAVIFFFKQHPSDLEEIVRLWNLPQGQIDHISKLDKYQCLMRVGNLAAAIDVGIMPYEEEFVFVDKVLAAQEKEQSDLRELRSTSHQEQMAAGSADSQSVAQEVVQSGSREVASSRDETHSKP